MKKLTTKEFISRAEIIHKNKYLYTNSIYTTNRNKIEIICNTHGIFWQDASSHLRGRGCLECSGLKKLTKEKFIKKATQIYGNLYNYDLVDYINLNTKVKIKCRIHGIFLQTPSNHLQNNKCLKCSYLENTKKLTKTNTQFIEEANKIHNNFYDYTLVEYIKAHENIIIKCKIHGNFLQTPHSHLKGSLCPQCVKIKNKLRVATKNLELLKERLIIIHKNKYTYNFSNYKNQYSKISVTCPIHGEFLQKMASHLRGTGCKQCGDSSNYVKANWVKKAKNKEGTFYILKCWNKNESFFKLGITFNNIKQRYRSPKCMPYNFEIIKEIKSKNLVYIWDLEKRFKKFKRKNHYTPLINFGGYKTECFK